MYFSVLEWEFWVDSVDNWEWFPYCKRCRNGYEVWFMKAHLIVNRKMR